jgi:hypothetical protein
MWHEEHLLNVIVLQRVQLSNLVYICTEHVVTIVIHLTDIWQVPYLNPSNIPAVLTGFS